MAAGSTLPAESVSLEGVVVRAPAAGQTGLAGQPGPAGAAAAAAVTVPWDIIAGIDGPLAQRASWMSAAAEKAWRAVSRLERGDTVAAEPLLEELFALYAGRRGPTAERIAGGLLACRLRRGAVAGAVMPWLAWFNARAESQPTSLDIVAGRIDPATGLAPDLPPVWLDVPATDALARGQWLTPAADGEPLSPAALDLAALYEQAARHEVGLEAMLPPERSSDAGIRLVREMVAARVSPPPRRAEARIALLKMVDARPAAWTEAWIRVAVGRSLLMEPDRESRLLGVAHLAHVPARLSRESPYLTGVAIAEMAVAVAHLGDAADAVGLRDELASSYGGHPALEWPPLRAIVAPPPSAKPAVQPTQPTTQQPDELPGEGGPN